MPRRPSAAWPPRSPTTLRHGSTVRLCLAWAGLDRQAIECLDQVAGLEADSDPKKAVEAWTLAEILRQAGGAESLSDDLRYACTFAWNAEQTASLRTSFPEIRRIPTPRDPTRPEASARGPRGAGVARSSLSGGRGSPRRERPPARAGHGLRHAGCNPALQSSGRDARARRGEAAADAGRRGPAAGARGRPPAPPLPGRRCLDHPAT